jgi:2-dehydropantoate 2-reductase
MKTQGLRVIMREEESQVPVQAFHVCDLAGLKRQVSIVFLTAKSYDTRWMVELVKPYLKTDGVLVSVQNSLNDEWIAPMIGHERDIACAFSVSAEVFEPGLIRCNTDHDHSYFVLGELDGTISPRIQEIAQILSEAGKTQVSTNIWGAKWTKLVVNTMIMALCSTGGIGSWDMAHNPKYLGYAVKLGRETVQVAKALGHILEPLFGLVAEDFINASDETIGKLLLKVTSDIGKGTHNAALQDILKGRLTELSDYINGLVIKKGREVSVPTPLNEAATSLVRQIEEGKLKPSLSSLEILEHYL